MSAGYAMMTLGGDTSAKTVDGIIKMGEGVVGDGVVKVGLRYIDNMDIVIIKNIILDLT